LVCLLARAIGIGIETADMPVQEMLPRNLRDRRAVSAARGLTGSPDESAGIALSITLTLRKVQLVVAGFAALGTA
jgi:hypothetical protein